MTITIAHHALRRDHRGPLKFWMALTILLGLSFIALQAFEYHEAYTKLGLTLGSGIYGATFFMLTGFHGAHVTLGTIILIVMFVRILRGHFNPEKHFGFEQPAGIGTSSTWCGWGCSSLCMCCRANRRQNECSFRRARVKPADR